MKNYFTDRTWSFTSSNPLGQCKYDYIQHFFFVNLNILPKSSHEAQLFPAVEYSFWWENMIKRDVFVGEFLRNDLILMIFSMLLHFYQSNIVSIRRHYYNSMQLIHSITDFHCSVYPQFFQRTNYVSLPDQCEGKKRNQTIHTDRWIVNFSDFSKLLVWGRSEFWNNFFYIHLLVVWP